MLRCPICKKKVTLSNPEMPFCSERCRLLDLANWASEKYVISTPLHEPGGDSPEGPEQSESGKQEGTGA
jgi:endogenous inhibitor of DNA gyrase (YacG/DUF329 family)